MKRLAIETTAEIDRLLMSPPSAAVAIGVSGGKDSQAAALAVATHLDSVGHTGPRILVHSDLGVVEWKESLAVCERLADHLGYELLVLRRTAGDMMDRWEARWQSSVGRYTNLETVTLVLPWSTPSMRFCTSELKTQLIGSALNKRYPSTPIVNVTGIRREESQRRRSAKVSNFEKRFSKPGRPYWTWQPLVNWSIDDVFETIQAHGLALHEAYTRYGMSRVSCMYCIMSNASDMAASTTCPDNHDTYRRMVDLEIASTFGFQSSGWLADVAPHLLTDEQLAHVRRAKDAAQAREAAESRIPRELLYVKGWPTRLPTKHEASILAEVRQAVGGAVGLNIKYDTGSSIIGRYADLISLRGQKQQTRKAQIFGVAA